jgi:hypothetical protein
MKTKVICGRKPNIREAKTKTRVNAWDWNRGAIVSPARRGAGLILVTLRLIARKIGAKE